MDEG
jgi:hypothetical protein